MLSNEIRAYLIDALKIVLSDTFMGGPTPAERKPAEKAIEELEALPYASVQPASADELLQMIDDLLVLSHRPDHTWEEDDYMLRDCIEQRHRELTTDD